MAENPKEEEKTSEAKDQAEGTEAPAAAPEELEAVAEGELPAEKADEQADEDDEQEDDEEDKAATQEAIARRVAALGEEDAIERIAREEEEKLAERRRLQREAKKGKGKKKTGLEAAASKRLAKIGTKAPAPKRAVATAVDADPLIEKTAEFSKWVKKNQKGVGILAAAAAVLGIGFGVYMYMQDKRENNASVALAAAVADERGRIGDPAKEDDDPDRPKDPRPIFKTAVERRDSALAKYREIETKYTGTGAAYLARLGEGSLLLDKQDSEGAIAAFNDAQNSPLAKVDPEVRGRALEGLGFAYELKAQAASGDEKTKWQDEALKRFHELENTDIEGFKEFGIYHQARVSQDKGDKDKAKELLKTLNDRLSKPGESKVFPALQQLVEDRLRALDPSALPPKTPLGGGAFGGNKPTEAQIRAIQEAMRKAQQQKGGGAPQ
ncbi:hypothetical protein LVJ94_19970 [Pendulispora rubella]|uniref:Tetratricopeptide repeat-like domain-containing protein n=1 Tax=Pendulispora rubella TaxID=2741070 RepID=A0ABZ2LK32_9BACT